MAARDAADGHIQAAVVQNILESYLEMFLNLTVDDVKQVRRSSSLFGPPHQIRALPRAQTSPLAPPARRPCVLPLEAPQ